MIEKVEYHYRIRRKLDGRFSTGGQYPSWDNKGKTWKKIGHLKAHLSQFAPDSAYRSQIQYNPYDDCELVVQRVTVVYEDVETRSLDDTILEMEHVRQKKAVRQKRQEAEYQLRLAQQRVADLKKQLGKE